MRWRKIAQGVIVLRAKKSEKGRTPSFAISCLTGGDRQHCDFSQHRTQNHLPLEAVKVMTTIFAKIQAAIIPDITRGARSPPNTAPKKTVAISSLQSDSNREIEADW